MTSLSTIRNIYRQHGIRGILSTLINEPSKALEVLDRSPSHFYHLELPVFREDVVTFVRPLVDVSEETILTTWAEVDEGTFKASIEANLAQTQQRPDTLHSNWRELLYTLIRITEPEVVVETGIFDGLSSAYILHALERNGSGTLYSIDLNDKERLPDDIPAVQAGWVVPSKYETRWERSFGDAKELLPELTGNVAVDCFLHDSLHTAEHMQFEFETAVESMGDGGLIIADNVRFNDVFWEFAQDHLTDVVYWKNTSEVLDHEGNQVNDRLGAGRVRHK